MLIILRLARKTNGTFPFQCRPSILDFHFRGFRHYGARQTARPGPLRPILLCHVHGRFDCGGLVHVGTAALTFSAISASVSANSAVKVVSKALLSHAEMNRKCQSSPRIHKNSTNESATSAPALF